MKVSTARKVVSDDTGKVAMNIALARGNTTPERVHNEAKSLLTRINKRERRRRKA